jgi:hypothetical protein
LKLKKFTWSYNENDELWQHDDFDTKEECILDAKENYQMKAGDSIAIGVSVPFAPSIDGERILEQLEEDAYEECGETSEGWIDYKKDNIERLSNTLTKCINDWLKDTKQEPTFYQIANIETVTL